MDESEREIKLVFYAQSTGTFISGREGGGGERERETERERENTDILFNKAIAPLEGL